LARYDTEIYMENSGSQREPLEK